MPRQILLPFDHSDVSVALMKRAARLARHQGAGIVVATPGLDADDLAAAMASVRAIVGDEIAFNVRLVGVEGSAEAFLAIADEINPFTILAPLGPVNGRPLAAVPAALLRRNLLVYGLSGLVAPFIGIKAVDLLVGVAY